ncbi:hypothetical protein ERJ75_000689000 [Trypanosoma vivax]|nr:hypothetical protein ERJ75_000689000 [Trypanosoma vivax]
MRMERRAGTISAGEGAAKASATGANAEEQEERPSEHAHGPARLERRTGWGEGVALRRASGAKRRCCVLHPHALRPTTAGNGTRPRANAAPRSLGGTTRRARGNSSDKETNTHLNDALTWSADGREQRPGTETGQTQLRLAPRGGPGGEQALEARETLPRQYEERGQATGLVDAPSGCVRT